MGQHKYNPTAQAAKRGELPPKHEKMSKREVESIVFTEIYRRLGIDKLEQATGINPIYWGRMV